MSKFLFAYGQPISTFDIATLVHLAMRDKKTGKQPQGSIIDKLIEEALLEFTSLTDDDAPEASRRPGGMSSVSGAEFVDPTDWANEIGFGSTGHAPVSAADSMRASLPPASFQDGNLSALEDDGPHSSPHGAVAPRSSPLSTGAVARTRVGAVAAFVAGIDFGERTVAARCRCTEEEDRCHRRRGDHGGGRGCGDHRLVDAPDPALNDPLDRKPPTTVAAIVELLAPTLGVEKSTELVTSTAARLGYTGIDTFTGSQSLAILRTLGKVDGLVGVVARFAVSRSSSMSLPAVQIPTPPPSSSSLSPPEAASASAAPRAPARTSPTWPNVTTLPAYELEEILEGNLGADRARALIAQTATRLGLGPGPYIREDALALIDAMADDGGIIGVVARFARARVLLKLK